MPAPRCPIVDEAALRRWKDEGPRHLLGVMGFAGAWSRSGHQGDALRAFKLNARRALEQALLAARDAWGPRLAVVSGATDAGVLQLAYALCAAHGIPAAGVAPRRVLRYRTAEMALLLLHGQRFGDESALFVDLCDDFLVLGGGPQSEREARMAVAAGKPVTLIRGFGGAADALAAEGLAGARVVVGR